MMMMNVKSSAITKTSQHPLIIHSFSSQPIPNRPNLAT